MDRLIDTFWLISALVITSALALVTLPILALGSFLVLMTPVVLHAISRGRQSSGYTRSAARQTNALAPPSTEQSNGLVRPCL